MSGRMTADRLVEIHQRRSWHPDVIDKMLDQVLAELDAVTRERDEATKVSWARMEYLFHALGFPIRHRWGGDVREFAEGVDAARQKPIDTTPPSSGSYSGMNFITNRDGTVR